MIFVKLLHPSLKTVDTVIDSLKDFSVKIDISVRKLWLGNHFLVVTFLSNSSELKLISTHKQTLYVYFISMVNFQPSVDLCVFLFFLEAFRYTVYTFWPISSFLNSTEFKLLQGNKVFIYLFD